MTAAVLQWHENPRLLHGGQTVAGQVAVWASATALLLWHDVTFIMPLAIALVMVSPQHRRLIVSLAAAGAIIEYFADRSRMSFDSVIGDPGTLVLPVVQIAMIVAGLYALYWLARWFARWPALARRYPVITLHAGFWAGLALVGPFPVLAVLFELGPWLIWRISYLVQLAHRGRLVTTSFRDHLMYLWPVFGGNTPHGKGFEYLSRHEAADRAANAQSQLAGIKLLILAVLWHWATVLMDTFIFGGNAGIPATTVPLLAAAPVLSVPHLADAITAGDTTTGTAWTSMFAELVRTTLVIATRGHIVVGCLRLLGFNVFRNTYKPFLSESILEFWNRFNHYFKELMVEFFFYPVFLRATWAGPRLRLFLAVFAAAFVGNMYFHILLYPEWIAAGDIAAIWTKFGPRTVYCFFLALGVWISMARQQAQRKKLAERPWYLRARAIAGVLTFYAIIHVWNLRADEATMMDRAQFCLRLIGIHW